MDVTITLSSTKKMAFFKYVKSAACKPATNRQDQAIEEEALDAGHQFNYVERSRDLGELSDRRVQRSEL